MNGQKDITPRLREWIKEPVSLRAHGVERVAQLVHDTPQQHGWLPPLPAGRLGHMLTFAGGAATGVAVVLLAGLLLLALLSDPGSTVPAPAASTPSSSPSAGPPNWPAVTFEPVVEACPDGCDWTEGGVWSVSAEHRGDLGSTQALAFGPEGAPWVLSDDTVWQLGAPGTSAVPGTSAEEGDQVSGLALADDGTVWVAGAVGLRSFDGEAWTEHWTDGTLADVQITPDGEVLAVGGGRRSGLETTDTEPIVVVRADQDGAGVDAVAVLPRKIFPTSVMATPDGQLWVSAVETGFTPIAEGESLIAHFDGEAWEAVRPLGPGVDVAAWTLAAAPDGSLWASIWALPADGMAESYLAHHDGQGWTLHQTEDGALLPRLGLAVAPDGTVWSLGEAVTDDEPRGLVAFDGQAWTRYLVDEWVSALAIAPDGTVFATTVPGFDEDGQLYAIRP